MQHEDMIIELSQSEIHQVSGAGWSSFSVGWALGENPAQDLALIGGIDAAVVAAVTAIGFGIKGLITNGWPNFNINWDGCSKCE